jgi:hypothetical protein
MSSTLIKALNFFEFVLIFWLTHSMALAYAARPPSFRHITAVIYCAISLMSYKFVIDDGLESFSSEMMLIFLKNQFEFI